MCGLSKNQMISLLCTTTINTKKLHSTKRPLTDWNSLTAVLHVVVNFSSIVLNDIFCLRFSFYITHLFDVIQMIHGHRLSRSKLKIAK